MHVIVVYDVGLERLDAVRHVLKKYLNWIQNSVFEGEITLGKLEELKIFLLHVINKDKDSIIVFSINNPKWINKMIWGIEKDQQKIYYSQHL